MSVFVPKIPFLAESLFVEHTLLEEMILNEAKLGGSPIISGTLEWTNKPAKAKPTEINFA